MNDATEHKGTPHIDSTKGLRGNVSTYECRAEDIRKLSAQESAAKLASMKGAPVTRDDAATGKLLQAMLDIVAECDQVPEFAGFQIQEARNAGGLLLSVRLVPCDNVGGIVSPRTV